MPKVKVAQSFDYYIEGKDHVAHRVAYGGLNFGRISGKDIFTISYNRCIETSEHLGAESHTSDTVKSKNEALSLLAQCSELRRDVVKALEDDRQLCIGQEIMSLKYSIDLVIKGANVSRPYSVPPQTHIAPQLIVPSYKTPVFTREDKKNLLFEKTLDELINNYDSGACKN